MMRNTRVRNLLCRICCTALLATGCTTMRPAQDAEPRELARVGAMLQAVLDELDADLGELAGQIARTGLAGKATEAAMARFGQRHSYVFAYITADTRGTVLAVGPEASTRSFGSSIHGQEHINRIHAERNPVLGRTLPPARGIPAVGLHWPVLDDGGALIGSVGAMIKPAHFMDAIIQPAVRDTVWECQVIQTDGEILYDRDPAEIGRNLLADPVHATLSELKELGRRIVAERSGQGSYRFLSTGLGIPQRKEARWSSIGLHGTEWRVVFIKDN